MKKLLISFLIIIFIILSFSWNNQKFSWTDREISLITSMALDQANTNIPDPSNAVSKDTIAIKLGELLFFEDDWGKQNGISCATCHRPENYFTDGLSKGFGIDTLTRNTPSILSLEHSPWLYWDGRRDNLWSQALTPMEAPNEMGLKRGDIVNYVLGHEVYGDLYNKLFKKGVNQNAESINKSFSNIGKAIAAFEITLRFKGSKFDKYAESLKSDLKNTERIFTNDEREGLRLFLSEEVRCTQCHNGPLFSNYDFHNTGLSTLNKEPDFGRAVGLLNYQFNEFNCTGEYSDCSRNECENVMHLNRKERKMAAFKTPSLRNVKQTAPYMHDGRFKNLSEVLEHYRNAPRPEYGVQELKPLDISDKQLLQLEAFLGTLTDTIQIYN
ncbi:cytochrome-c peroxidase [Maribacter sp. X9]|uniref:cytochrome-c peroxidase n=1 Tax=Maribacter sp. X9 TaxID=3402159 RepID=UPI003AF3F964